MDLAEHDDPEWNEDCQTPAVIGGRVRRVPNKDAVKKGASCTACTQMFSKRVEGHQKSHKRCPFYSMYLLDKDIKSLEVQDGIEAKDELQAKTAELSTETERLRKAVLDGVIQPVDDAGFSPEVDADSVRDSFSSDDTHEKTNASSGSEGDTPAGARLDVPLSELITTCREARRRAEGLLHASGGTAATNVSRSPFGDVSNSGPGSASATVDVRKRMSFGGVTVGRGSTGGVEETETGGVEETEEFQFKPMVNATEEFQFKPVVNATEEFQFQSSVNPDDL
jgi:hypothetical protein